MKTIYVVTSGEYSDYAIHAVFTTEELAEQYIKAFSGYSSWSERSIEKYPLNPHEKQIKSGKEAYSVTMDKQGNTKNVAPSSYDYGFEESEEGSVSFTRDKSCMISHCFAKDEKHAVKITNERRVQYIANNNWGENT